MSVPMDNLSGMASSNQMQGGNAIAGIRLGQIAARRKARSKSNGGGQQFDKAYFENMAELDTHREQLRRTGVESDANVKDLETTRSYNIDGGPGHIQGRTTAIRDSSRYHDDEGNVLGEVPIDDKTMGIATKGMRMPIREPKAEAPASTERPDVGQQMEEPVRQIRPEPPKPGYDRTYLGTGIPVATGSVNADRDPDGTFTMGTGPGVRRDGGQKGFDFPMRGELDKWKAQQTIQNEQHPGATPPKKGKPKAGKPKAGKPEVETVGKVKEKTDVASPVAEAIGGSVGAGIGAAVGSLAGPLGTAAGGAGGRALGTAIAGAVVKKKPKKAPSSSGAPKTPSAPTP